MEKGYIYKIISPTNRIYIGKTFNLEKRVRSYKGLWCKKQRVLYKSLVKYGWDKHSFEILFEDFCSEEYLSELETKYIIEYNSFRRYNYKFGMNLTLGGEGSCGLKHTDKTKKMISETKKKAKRTEKEILASEKRRGTKVYKSEEWIKNNAESIKKPILQYDLDGNFIKEWKSAKDIELELGFSRKNISCNVRYKSNSAFNFIWIFKNADLKIDDILIRRKRERKKPTNSIKVLDIECNIVYDSIMDVVKNTNMTYAKVYRVIYSNDENKKYIIYEEK
jgi:group I intron endonuclease